MPVREIFSLPRRSIRISKPDIGCMNNIHHSVANLRTSLFRQGASTMLLQPKNAAKALCTNQKLKIGSNDVITYYLCQDRNCCAEGEKLLSYYKNVPCYCGGYMSDGLIPSVPEHAQDKGAFVKASTHFSVSEELHVSTASSAASFSLLSKLQVKDVSVIEERTFDIGVDKVLELLYYSLISKKPLTETLLEKETSTESRKRDIARGICIKQEAQGQALEGRPGICMKLFVSKSRRTVCYAEANEEFIDLLFSFLTIPLGHVQKISDGGDSIGCIAQLYKSVRNIDDPNCFKSSDHKEILLSPKIPEHFGYKNQLLGLEEVNHKFFWLSYDSLLIDKLNSTLPLSNHALTLMDPKVSYKGGATGGGFLGIQAMFTVTVDLIITPISPVLRFSILKKLNVACSDVEEINVFVGEKEASRLLVAAFTFESVLTEVFMSKDLKNDFILKD